jgi:hypothetical protein
VPRGIIWGSELGLTRSYVVDLPPGFYSTPGNTCNGTNAALPFFGFNCKDLWIIPGINFTAGPGATAVGNIPYANGAASIGYSWEPRESIAVTATYLGNNNPLNVPAFVAFGAQASYPLGKDLSLFATLNNVTNIHGSANAIAIPQIGAPMAFGPPIGLAPQGYGPRSLILSLNYRT